MKILALSYDRGGCLWYRILLPLEQLSRAGHDVRVHYGEQVGDQRFVMSYPIHRSGEIGYRHPDGRDEYGFDVVLMQRLMFERTADDISRARTVGQVVINDVDDWLLGLPAHNLASRAVDPRIYRKVLSASDCITASTPHLAERLRSLGRPVHVLENAIDLERWEMGVVRETRDPDIGWVGALDFRDGDMNVVSGTLRTWMRGHPDSRFIHVGSYVKRHGMIVDGDIGERLARESGVAWSRIVPAARTDLQGLPQAMRPFDIALAPLARTSFNLSKSWIKSLEAAAAGVPCVASDLPEYRRLGAALLCRNPSDWRKNLERLCDPIERRLLAMWARAIAAEHDIATTWRRWEAVFRSYVEQEVSA